MEHKCYVFFILKIGAKEHFGFIRFFLNVNSIFCTRTLCYMSLFESWDQTSSTTNTKTNWLGFRTTINPFPPFFPKPPNSHSRVQFARHQYIMYLLPEKMNGFLLRSYGWWWWPYHRYFIKIIGIPRMLYCIETLKQKRNKKWKSFPECIRNGNKLLDLLKC